MKDGVYALKSANCAPSEETSSSAEIQEIRFEQSDLQMTESYSLL